MNDGAGPDFPTGGFILGATGFSTTSRADAGAVKMRAKAATRESARTASHHRHGDSVPGEQGAADRADRFLVNEKKIEGISDIRDESDRDGMRIVLRTEARRAGRVILNNLYKHTQMQTGFGVIMLAIVNGQPRELGLIDIRRFIEHRIDVVRRRTDYLLRKAREREHLLLGFQKALNHLDAVSG
jgi:DNA gyrase subunit A